MGGGSRRQADEGPVTSHPQHQPQCVPDMLVKTRCIFCFIGETGKERLREETQIQPLNVVHCFSGLNSQNHHVRQTLSHTLCRGGKPPQKVHLKHTPCKGLVQLRFQSWSPAEKKWFPINSGCPTCLYGLLMAHNTPAEWAQGPHSTAEAQLLVHACADVRSVHAQDVTHASGSLGLRDLGSPCSA